MRLMVDRKVESEATSRDLFQGFMFIDLKN